MSSPKQHPQIVELIRLRKAANDLSCEITGLEFRWERDMASDAERVRCDQAKVDFDCALVALRDHMARVREVHAEALAAYHVHQVEAARREAHKDPDDWHAASMLARWERVAAGEIDDIIFEQLSETPPVS